MKCYMVVTAADASDPVRCVIEFTSYEESRAFYNKYHNVMEDAGLYGDVISYLTTPDEFLEDYDLLEDNEDE